MATITAKAIATSNNTYAGWVNGGSITFDDFTSGDKSQDAGSLLVNPSELEKIPVGSIINSVTLCYTSKVNKDQYKAGIYVTPYYLTSYTITGNTYTYTGASKAGDKIHSTQSNSTSGYDGSVPLGAWDVSKIKSGMRLAMGIDVKKSSITIIPCDLTISNIRVVIDYTVPTYIFDLNGSLDGGDPNGNISGWGTADVYINGALSSWEEKPSSGVNDFYGSFDYGTTYEVKNIVTNSGYKYIGNSSYSGTLTSNTTIVLPFETTSTNMTYIGTKQPTFYIGTKQVQSIYLGMSLIYEVVLPKISYDSIKTFGNLLVPSEETLNTYNLPPANLENAEGNISYALYSDNECTTSVGTGITFDENTRQVTVSNAAKDTVATQDTDKDGLAKFYIKATYESLSAIGEITLENYKVTATFSYRNNEDTYVDKSTEVYYGTSVKEFANGITDFWFPENDETYHYINNGWVDFYDVSTLQRVLGDTTFVLSYTQEPHEINTDAEDYVLTPATCTVAGSKSGTCKVCGISTSIEIPATGHTDTDGDNICDVCGESIVQIVDSGTCGSNLTYTLDSNGVLTISGTGDMQDSSIGWDKDKIQSVVINDGVTSIGQHAFSSCTRLTSITIPDSVTSIGRYAFLQCTDLTSITIPNSVTSIGSSAFGYCESLTSITIPDSVTSIENNVFYGCPNLTSITVSTGNTVYHSTDNCLIETESKTLICGFKNSIIPTDGSVTRINDSAFFNCDGLTSITIPDSVTRIGRDAFYDCSNLKEVDFSTCTDIPTLESSNAFSNTYSNLVIKVPSALLDEWKAATNWSTYADKIVGVRL